MSTDVQQIPRNPVPSSNEEPKPTHAGFLALLQRVLDQAQARKEAESQ